MAGFDVGTSFAAGGAAEALQQLFAQRLAQQQLLMHEQDRQDALAERAWEHQQAAQQRQDLLAETTRNHTLEDQARQATNQDRQIGLASTLADQIPPDTFVAQTDPAVGILQTGGRGSLLQPTAALAPMGADFQGPSPNATPQQMQQGRPQGYLKTASAKQQTDAENADIKQELAALKANGGEPLEQVVGSDGKPIYVPRSQAVGQQAYHTPPQAQTVTIQTVDDQGNPVTRIVPKTAGASYAARPSTNAEQTKERQKTGAAAVDRLDTEIDAADKAGLIGPAAGRYYDALAKFGTTGDPQKDALIGQLKSDLILAKLHVDSGIGGARAASSPLLMQRWEDLAMHSSKALMHGYTKEMKADMLGGAEPSTPATTPKRIVYDINGKPVSQ